MPKPGTLVPYRLNATAIADFAADDIRTEIATAMAEDWKTIARIEGNVPHGWALAHSVIEAGAQGAIVPSVQNRGGTNLVLWRWHDAAKGAGEGAALSLVDPEAALARPGRGWSDPSPAPI